MQGKSLDDGECSPTEEEREPLVSGTEDEGEYTVTPLPNSPSPETSHRAFLPKGHPNGGPQRPAVEKLDQLHREQQMRGGRTKGMPSMPAHAQPVMFENVRQSTPHHPYAQPMRPAAFYQANHVRPPNSAPVSEERRNFGNSVEASRNSDSGGVTSSTGNAVSLAADVKSTKGRELLGNLRKALEWKNTYEHPSQEFLSLMDRLFMECQLHLTALSSRGDMDSKKEADALVNEMIIVRNHWGPKLLPNSVCNAFVRERIPLTLGVNQRQFRIDCAQFFEPVPFYGNQQGNPGELMKMFRFSVYDTTKNEVVLRYYLERSNVIQMYHVLCFTCENYRGQVHPYGSECPSYWEIRHHMLEDVYSRLLNALSQGSHPAPRAHAATIFPPVRGTGPVIIQIDAPNKT